MATDDTYGTYDTYDTYGNAYKFPLWIVGRCLWSYGLCLWSCGLWSYALWSSHPPSLARVARLFFLSLSWGLWSCGSLVFVFGLVVFGLVVVVFGLVIFGLVVLWSLVFIFGLGLVVVGLVVIGLWSLDWEIQNLASNKTFKFLCSFALKKLFIFCCGIPISLFFEVNKMECV